MSNEADFFNLLASKEDTKADTATEGETVSTDEEEPVRKEASIPATVTRRNLFTHPDAHPLVLDLALIKKYGADWLEWEPETIQYLVPQDFNSGGISDLAMSKIMACKTLHLVDTFWKQWEVFIWCTMPFNKLFPDFEVMQVPTVAQCLVSVDIANQIRTDVVWSDEIKSFLSVVFRHDGILLPLSPLDFVPLDTEGFGVNAAELSRSWADCIRSASPPKEETMIDEQLRRLYDAQTVQQNARDSMRYQLKLVEDV